MGWASKIKCKTTVVADHTTQHKRKNTYLLNSISLNPQNRTHCFLFLDSEFRTWYTIACHSLYTSLSILSKFYLSHICRVRLRKTIHFPNKQQLSLAIHFLSIEFLDLYNNRVGCSPYGSCLLYGTLERHLLLLLFDGKLSFLGNRHPCHNLLDI